MRRHFRQSIEFISYLPACAFLLIAAGWLSMIMLYHNPGMAWAWAFTFWTNNLLKEIYYFFSHFGDIPIFGHLAVAVGAALFSALAVYRNWRASRFLMSHYALLLMSMPLVGQGTRLSGPPGDINLHLLFRLTEHLSPITVGLVVGLLVACGACHYVAVVKGICRESDIRRRLRAVEIGW